jgi:hypothetical protein
MRRLAFALLFLLASAGGALAQQSGNNTAILVANNTTPILISSRNATLTGLDTFNNGTAVAYIRIYNFNTITGITCGQAGAVVRGMIPASGTNPGGGYITGNNPGDAFTSGMVICITTDFADGAGPTAPAASTYIVNVHWR